MHVVPSTFAQISPPAQARSFSQRTRLPSHRTWTTARGSSVTGSRRTSSLVPSLVITSPAGFPSTGTAQIPQPSRLNRILSAICSVAASQRSATRSFQVSCQMLPPTRQIPSANRSGGNGASAATSAAPSSYRRSTDIPYCPPDSHIVVASSDQPLGEPARGMGERPQHLHPEEPHPAIIS